MKIREDWDVQVSKGNGVTESMDEFMKKNEMQEVLQKRQVELEKYLEMLQMRIVQEPEGHLRISRTGKIQYYRVTKDTEPNGIYLSKKNLDLIRRLAQKEYDKKVILEMQKELSKIKKMQKEYKAAGIEKIYNQYVEERKELVQPIVLSDDVYAKKWLEEDYRKKEINNAVNVYQTEGGELVRSKSELIIANKLKKWKIPYRYEEELILEDGTKLHPDFTILNVRERKIYYYEHLGMMDNAEYAEHALERIIKYEKNGIFPGKKLILSHESSNRPLDPILVDEIIRQYLV